MTKEDAILARRMSVRRLRRQKLGYEAIKSAIERQLSTYDPKTKEETQHYEYGYRTYIRDVETIYAEDLAWARKESADSFLSSYRLSLESLEEQQRQLSMIAATAARDYDKIQARRAIADIEVMIISLLAQGPTVVEYDRRMRAMSIQQAKVVEALPRGEPTPQGLAPEEINKGSRTQANDEGASSTDSG
jgi:hypothetical protein